MDAAGPMVEVRDREHSLLCSLPNEQCAPLAGYAASGPFVMADFPCLWKGHTLCFLASCEQMRYLQRLVEEIITAQRDSL